MAYPVSVIQLAIDADYPGENLRAALALVAEAVAKGARLVLLPEAAVTDFYKGAEALAESIPGPLTDEFAAIADEAVIALPLLEKCEHGVFSSCALIGKSGVLGIARRTHLYRDPSGLDELNEGDYIHAGSTLNLHDLGGIRVGVALGFDADFPEVFRAFALGGADIVLVALNCVEPDLEFLSAMARRNRLPIAVANRLGFKRVYPAEPEFSASRTSLVQDQRGKFMARCKGGSAIIGADGSIEARPNALKIEAVVDAPIPVRVKIPGTHFQDECILTASFVLEELRIERLTHPFLAARRPELYL